MQIDGTDPPCFANSSSPLEGEDRGEGGLPGVNSCWIPPLDEAGGRIMEIRNKLITLGERVGPDTIIKMYEVTKEDLALLEFVETELKPKDTEP